MKIKELLKEVKVHKLDPETEKQLEQTLAKLTPVKDIGEAKKIAHEFLDNMKFQEKAEKYKRLVDRARSVKDVIKFVYDVKLAGEGLGVIRESERSDAQAIINDLQQIDVDNRINSKTGESAYVDKKEKRYWTSEDIEWFDWKDTVSAVKKLKQMKGKVVVLFDGSDSIILASLEDVKKL